MLELDRKQMHSRLMGKRVETIKTINNWSQYASKRCAISQILGVIGILTICVILFLHLRATRPPSISTSVPSENLRMDSRQQHAQPADTRTVTALSISNVGSQQYSEKDPSNMTTLVIMSYTNNEALMQVLSLYNNREQFGGILYEIVIVWNNPDLAFNFSHPSLLIDQETHIIPIHVYPQKKNSLANRWFIAEHHTFKTSSAVFIDDDMFINEYSISCMWQTFVRHEWKVIAPSYTHIHTTRQFEKATEGKDRKTGKLQWKYKNKQGKLFNMLLPGMSMFNTAYLPKLAATLEEYELLDIIDGQVAHCDDISMMLSMSMLSPERKYLFGIDRVLITDYSKLREQKPMTDKSKLRLRYKQRSECLTMIMHRFVEVNKEKHKEIISPIVDHFRGEDTINCRTCSWCDNRACWSNIKKKK